MARKALKKTVGAASPGAMAGEVLARGIEALKGFGLTVEHTAKPKADEGADVWLRVGRGRDRTLYAARVRKRLAPAALGPMLHPLAGAKGRAMLIAGYVTPPVALRLRGEGGAFFGGVGSA